MSRLLVFVHGLGAYSRFFCTYVAGAVALMCLWPSLTLAQGHTHSASSTGRNALVQVVREWTAQYKDVAAAELAEYHLMFGCVSGSDAGAMGLHYVNLSLVLDGELDPTRPEIVLYEQLPSGRLQITGADFLVFASDWEAKHPGTTPQLMGQLFHHFEAPNRFGLPAFYTLHVWAWKENPSGTFVNWHDNVSCDSFNPQQ